MALLPPAHGTFEARVRRLSAPLDAIEGRNGFCLNAFFSRLGAIERASFHNVTGPNIARAASSRAMAFVPKLSPGSQETVQLRREDVVSILAWGFLCWTEPETGYAGVSFAGLYEYLFDPVAIQKLMCLLRYFRSPFEGGVLTYRRLRAPPMPGVLEALSASEAPLTVQFCHSCPRCKGAAEVVYSLPQPGSGTLHYSSCHPEIRCLQSPEILAAAHFCHRLEDDEALEITGVVDYSVTSGLGSTFRYEGPATNRSPRTVVLMDVLPEESLRGFARNLVKALAGFSVAADNVVSGSWCHGYQRGTLGTLSALAAAAALRSKGLCVRWSLEDPLPEGARMLLSARSVGDLWRSLRPMLASV